MTEQFSRLFLQVIQSAASIAALSFVGGVIVTAWITKAIEYRYTKRLEAEKLSSRRAEDELKSQIKSREDEALALQAAALGQLGGRTAVLDKRKLDAAERVWAAVIDLGRSKLASKYAQTIKMEKLVEYAHGNGIEAQNTREFAALMWKTLGLDRETQGVVSPDKERPFVDQITWAKFAAFRSALSLPVAQFAAAMNGVSPSMLADTKPLLEAVKAAFPHWASFIDEHGASGLSFLIEDMESDVLKSVIQNLEGSRFDQAHFQTAQTVISEINRFTNSKGSVPAAPSVDLQVTKKPLVD